MYAYESGRSAFVNGCVLMGLQDVATEKRSGGFACIWIYLVLETGSITQSWIETHMPGVLATANDTERA